ncbi:transposase [Aeoliella straminimaris]|nr:transposase [Aeoliella straminimaris]
MPGEPHRKRVRHFDGRGHLHELTFSCYRRMPLLTNDVWQGILASSLSSACDEEKFELVAFVFMPEHVHLLVHPSSSDAEVSRLLARTKQPASKAVKQILVQNQAPLLSRLMVRERPGKTCFRFWQEGPGFDRNLFSAQAIEASIDDIHMNPVKRGLCKRATDRKWSSARYYLENIVDPALPPLTKPSPQWFDRSGVQTEHS